MRQLLARRLGLAGLTALIVTGPVLGQSWHQQYRLGEEALKRQKWAQAVEHLARAIELHVEPDANARTPDGSDIAYHPYLKIGIAYYNLGQFEAALQAFQVEWDYRWIVGSASDLQNLRTFQRLAREGVDDRQNSAQRLTAFINEALGEAESLERVGELDEAIAAVSRALGADPASAAARSAMQRLRANLAARQHNEEDRQRAAGLLAEGKQLLGSGEYEEASSRFRQVLAIDADPAVRALLDQASDKLRERVQAEQDAETRRSTIRAALDDARGHESGGRYGQGLDALESVFALDPANDEAAALQERLMAAQQQVLREQRQGAQIAGLLEESELLIGAGRFEDAADRLNLVLALEPEHARARDLLDGALASYRETAIDDVGTQRGPKQPPTIAIIDTANEVSSPDYVLRGVVIDDQPRVQIALFQKRSRETDDIFSPVSLDTLVGKPWGELFRFDFAHALKLSAGVTSWKVVARDGDQLSAEYVHETHYVRPWIRGPWPLLIGAVAIVGTAAGYQARRARRRRNLMRRHYNPYVAGAPVLDQNLFFGRNRLMSRVLQSVHNNSLLLYGERRIGKTSFQHHLKRRLEQLDDPEFRFYPVYIDLQGVPEEKFFSTIAEEIFDELGDLVGTAGQRDVQPYDYRALVRDLREVLKTLKSHSDRRPKLTLLIDEVDELNDYDPKINQRLRSLFMKSFADNLVAVVTGVRINKHWASEGSPWYNFFEEVEVKPFSVDDARELVERPIRGLFQLDSGVVDRVVTATGCRPYLIQKICVELVNRMHQENRRRITVADVEAVGPPAEG